MDWSGFKTNIHTDKPRSSVPVYRDRKRPRAVKPHNYSKSNRGNFGNRYYKYILPIILSGLFPSQSLAETVGGVSATAAPVANSSGSVTNQAIQVLQGPYITNTYGGGVQCQGATRNFTPYVTGTTSFMRPYEAYYPSPVYDMRDLTGDFDDDGNAIPDGAPDSPGSILYNVPTRTGQKDNYSIGLGFSLTWSTPLDKKAQALCKEAAETQIKLQQQLTANKRLDFEIARLKNCGQLIKEGISFHPKSPYYSICADVMVQGVTYIKPHVHTIPEPTSSSSDSSPQQTEALQSLRSESAALLGGPIQIRP